MRLMALIGLLFMASCSHTAPSNYELDRRTGWSVVGSDAIDPAKEMSHLGVGNKLVGGVEKKEADWPGRFPSTLEKVWIYDQKLGEHWMQGTWVFLEVEPERWVSEFEEKRPLRKVEIKDQRKRNEDLD